MLKIVENSFSVLNLTPQPQFLNLKKTQKMTLIDDDHQKINNELKTRLAC